jgi:hypothetical protein
MSISQQDRQALFDCNFSLAKNGKAVVNLAMNYDIVNLNAVRSELANSELQVKALRGLVEQLEACQKRFNSIIEGIPVPTYKNGVTGNVRGIFDSEPSREFTTTQIRLILKDQGVDTKPRNFNSSLSTTLTRLGRAGFVTVSTNAEGTRVFKRKETTAT